MSKILDALKGISSFPGTLKDLLIEFEQRIGALESSAVDVAKVGADVVSDVSPTATLAARVASLEQTVADLVQTVADVKAVIKPPSPAATPPAK